MKKNFKSFLTLTFVIFLFTNCNEKKQIDPMKIGRVLIHEINGNFYFLSILNPDTSSFIEYEKHFLTFQYSYSYGDYKYTISYYKDDSDKNDLQRIQDEIKKINRKPTEVKNLSFKKISGIEFYVDGLNPFKKRLYCINNYVFELTVYPEYDKLGDNFDDPNINAFFNSFYITNEKVLELIKEDSLNNLNPDITSPINNGKNTLKNNSSNTVSGQRIDESYSKVKDDLINSGQDVKEEVENGLKYLIYGGYGKDGSLVFNRYNFDKNNICTLVIFSTNSSTLIDQVIEAYNASYTKINPEEGFLKSWVDPYDIKVSYKEELIKGEKFYYCFQYK
jgi:gas vesicle protein